MPHFSEEQFEGHKYSVTVESDGTWTAHVETLDREQFRDTTLQGLTTKVRAAIRRANTKLGIKATIVGIRKKDRGGWKEGDDPETWPTGTLDVIIRGYDDRKRSILYEVDGVKSTGYDRSGGSSGSGRMSELGLMSFNFEGMFTRRLTKEQAHEFSTLVTARQRADRALIKFAEEHRIGNVEEFIEAEVNKAAERAAAEVETEDPRLAPPKKARRR